jgi:hypothetical protein
MLNRGDIQRTANRQILAMTPLDENVNIKILWVTKGHLFA